MPAVLEIKSTLTDRYQTTVPESVRSVLKLDKRDKINYLIRSNGEVVLSRANADDDPVLGQFLSFLSTDMASHPERLQSVDSGLIQRIQTLVGKVEVNLNEALSEGDE